MSTRHLVDSLLFILEPMALMALGFGAINPLDLSSPCFDYGYSDTVMVANNLAIVV